MILNNSLPIETMQKVSIAQNLVTSYALTFFQQTYRVMVSCLYDFSVSGKQVSRDVRAISPPTRQL